MSQGTKKLQVSTIFFELVEELKTICPFCHEGKSSKKTLIYRNEMQEKTVFSISCFGHTLTNFKKNISSLR